MKRTVAFFITYLLYASTTQAQSAEWEWAVQANGYEHSSNTYGLWTSGAATDASGNIYVTGVFYADSTVFGNYVLLNEAGGKYGNIFLVKYSPAGAVIWAKSTTNSSTTAMYSTSIATDAAGNVFIAGTYEGATGPDTAAIDTFKLNGNAGYNFSYGGMFIAKYDIAGNATWVRSYAGGWYIDNANAIATDRSGNVYMTGSYIAAPVTFGSTTLPAAVQSSTYMFVVKYDPSGNVLWAKQPHESEAGTPLSPLPGSVAGTGIATDASGNVFVTGTFYCDTLVFGNYTFYTFLGGIDETVNKVFVAKYDSAGNVLWACNAAQQPLYTGTPVAITTDKSGNAIVTGNFTGDSVTFGNSTLYYVYSEFNYGNEDQNTFIAKYSPSGTVLWAQNTDNSTGTALATDPDNNIYLGGVFNADTIRFGNTTFWYAITPISNQYLVTFDSMGNVLCGTVLPEAGDACGLCTDAFGDAYFSSAFGTISLILGADTIKSTTTASEFYLGRYRCGDISIAPVDVVVNDTICTGDSVIFYSKTYYTAGSYNDTLSTFGNADSIVTLNLTLRPVPMDAISADKTWICPGDSTPLCSLHGFAAYQWNTGGSDSCTEAAQSGYYRLTVTDNNGCKAVTDSIAINMYISPGPLIIVAGDTLAAYGAISYQWLLNGDTIAGATNPIYIVVQPGSYSVEMVDSNGCFTKTSAIVFTGISEAAEENIFIYPNPSSGSWQLSVDNTLVGSALEVFDDEGKLVSHSEIKNQKSEIQLEAASGIYYLRISNVNESIVRKLVKM